VARIRATRKNLKTDLGRADDQDVPGPIHEGLVTLFANYPGLAFEMAQRCGARRCGEHERVSEGPTVFQDPGNPGRLFCADAVFVGWARRGGELEPVEAVALEVQRFHDALKSISWVVYRAGVRSRHRCRAWTLVVSPDPEVRERGRALFELEPELCPLILEPKMIPAIVDFDQARRRPDLAILAAVMHADTSVGVASARAALLAMRSLSRSQRQCYLPLVGASLTEEQMSELAKQLPEEVVEEFSAFERRGAWFTRAHQEGLHDACRELAASLKSALAERGISLSEMQLARVDACEDLRQLSAWLLRAGAASSADDIFAGE
jgi:hypothetical protein